MDPALVSAALRLARAPSREREKPSDSRVFRGAAESLEPSTFCMARSQDRRVATANYLQTRGNRRAGDGASAFVRECWCGFRREAVATCGPGGVATPSPPSSNSRATPARRRGSSRPHVLRQTGAMVRRERADRLCVQVRLGHSPSRLARGGSHAYRSVVAMRLSRPHLARRCAPPCRCDHGRGARPSGSRRGGMLLVGVALTLPRESASRLALLLFGWTPLVLRRACLLLFGLGGEGRAGGSVEG